MMNIQDCVVSAQLCIGNALEEMDKLVQLGLNEQDQETLKSVRWSLFFVVRELANIEGPGPMPPRQISIRATQ